MYYATIYEHPLAGGYLSRMPTSVSRKDAKYIAEVFNKGDFNQMIQDGFRFLIIRSPHKYTRLHYRMIYMDDNVGVLDMALKRIDAATRP